MVLNRQRRVSVDVARARAFARRLRVALMLGGRDFNVCLVDDGAMARLNAAFRGKDAATDVLSFPWTEAKARSGRAPKKGTRRSAGREGGDREFDGFLGDVVISVETARRNARVEGHSTANEIRWLILHGLLHLLGYNHETDRGEMTALELALRERLSIAGGARRRRRRARKS
jgi:probable rRNA maturation factor